MLRRIEVAAFVDWTSQLANAGQLSELRAERRAAQTAQYVARSIATALEQTKAADMFRVRIRLYHGWYSGLTATENFKALQRSKESLPNRVGKTTFDWQDMFGNTNIHAQDNRRHPKLHIHLPNTVRLDFDAGERRKEKMVDTAMACDVLQSARAEPDGWRLVMAEDDDVIPPVLVAERWAAKSGGKIIVLRRRAELAHLQIANLLCLLEAA